MTSFCVFFFFFFYVYNIYLYNLAYPLEIVVLFLWTMTVSTPAFTIVASHHLMDTLGIEFSYRSTCLGSQAHHAPD